MIKTSASVSIDVTCNYDTVYLGIEANNVKISGEDVNVGDIEAGQGKFDFALTQYTDSELTDAADENDSTELGSDLYFKLVMANPIPELIYSIQGLFLHMKDHLC